MPEFEEIFQTKEALGRFTEECGKLLTCNTSIEDAKEAFMQALKSMKELCEIIKVHELIDKAVSKAAASFKIAYNDPDYFSDFVNDFEVLIKAVQEDVAVFLADGKNPYKPEPSEKGPGISEREMAIIRERAALQDRMAVDWNQIKENEEKKKLDEEKSRQQRLREKEKELIYKDQKRVQKDMVIQGNSDVYFNKTLPPLELKPKEPETQKPESQKAPVFEKSASLEDSEKTNNSELQSNLQKLRVQSPPTNVQQSQKTETAREIAKERSVERKNIHQFIETSVSKPTKCRFCQDQILFGKALKCQECAIIIHRKCDAAQFHAIYDCMEKIGKNF